MQKWTEAFAKLAESADEDPVLHIEAREIHAKRKAGGVVWFDFKTLVRWAQITKRLS